MVTAIPPAVSSLAMDLPWPSFKEPRMLPLSLHPPPGPLGKCPGINTRHQTCKLIIHLPQTHSMILCWWLFYSTSHIAEGGES